MKDKKKILGFFHIEDVFEDYSPKAERYFRYWNSKQLLRKTLAKQTLIFAKTMHALEGLVKAKYEEDDIMEAISNYQDGIRELLQKERDEGSFLPVEQWLRDKTMTLVEFAKGEYKKYLP